jgi:hypothetical protein
MCLNKVVLCIGIVFVLCLPVAPVHATLFVFDPAGPFSGTPLTAHLQVAFTDVSGGVELKIASFLAPSPAESVDALYFNINPSKDSLLGSLSFTFQASLNSPTLPSIKVGADSFQADRGGLYDIMFAYGSPAFARISAEVSQTYLITTKSGTIDASDFTTWPSTLGAGDTSTHLAAIHTLHAGDGTGQGYVFNNAPVSLSPPPPPVPEPTTLLLFGSGLVGLAGWRWRRR